MNTELTNEEVHRILSNGLVNAPSEHEWCMAFEMALKALEQEPCDIRKFHPSHHSQRQGIVKTASGGKIVTDHIEEALEQKVNVL